MRPPRVFSAAALLVLALGQGLAGAAEPLHASRPVRLLVPFAPGGGSDAMARIIVPKMSEALGQQWVVDNRGGAAGNIAAELTAKSTPDGHTVFLGFNSVLTVNPSLYRLSFSMARDLQPVTLLATAQYILVIHASVPASTVQELVALAKQKPNYLNFASGGTGTPLHLAGELLKKRAGINMVHLPYKGGGPAAAAVLAGEAQVLFGSVASVMPHVKTGRLKALATTGSRRSKVVPDLPTMAESGFPGFDVTSWYAFLVPAGTPAAIVTAMRNAALKAVALPEIQEAMSRQGLDVETSTPQELAARITSETQTWAEVIKSAGIKPDS